MERRVAREPVLRADLELGRGPVDERDRVRVREHHALRDARRAGRVEDVGEVGGERLASGELEPVLVERDRSSAGSRRAGTSTSAAFSATSVSTGAPSSTSSGQSSAFSRAGDQRRADRRSRRSRPAARAARPGRAGRTRRPHSGSRRSPTHRLERLVEVEPDAISALDPGPAKQAARAGSTVASSSA